jgi:cell wall-associated NlpC family hydrolase
MIENTENEINQKDSSELMSDTENYSEKNQTQPKIKEAMNSAPNQNASFKLANISKSISGLMNGVIGSVANSFMDFIKSIFDKKPIDGGPYVKESLRNALSNGQAKSQNPIDPVRNKLNSFAQSYLAPGIKIQYSQDRDKRNGPNSFDCSGFITFVYKQFGLEISKANGGAPLVSQIIDKTGLFYKLDDKNDAKVGDLIVHKGQIDNHVGIFSRKDENGNVKEISATVGGKFEKSKLDPNDPLFKSSITEYPASSFGKDWAVYRWNK